MGAITFTTTLVSRGPGVAVLLDEAQVAAVGEGRLLIAAQRGLPRIWPRQPRRSKKP
jgi:hypothetical protein